MNVLEQVVKLRESDAREELQIIGYRIGYGRAQQILGELWDDLLEKEYQAPRIRGKMSVTVQDGVLAELKRLQAENVALSSALDKMVLAGEKVQVAGSRLAVGVIQSLTGFKPTKVKP